MSACNLDSRNDDQVGGKGITLPGHKVVQVAPNLQAEELPMGKVTFVSEPWRKAICGASGPWAYCPSEEELFLAVEAWNRRTKGLADD